MLTQTNLKKLWRIAGLKKNWNGYQAEPIPKLVILRTFLLLMQSNSDVEIFPLADGGIQIEAVPYKFELSIYEHKACIWKEQIGTRNIYGTFNIRMLRAELKVAIEESKENMR